VADLFERLGAEAVVLATRGGEHRPMPVKPALLTPDIRVGDDAGAAVEG
jgi:hypothetical protein